MEKERLVNFIATIMEDSGFEITKYYRVSNHVVDIYGTLTTSMGDVGVVVNCKNYEEPWKIGLDVLKDMEVVARVTNASKIIIFTTSSFTHGAAVYAQKRNIKLVDRKGLIKIAKNYADKRTIVTEPQVDVNDDDDFEYYNSPNYQPARLEPVRNNSHNRLSSGNNSRSRSNSGSRFSLRRSNGSSNRTNSLSSQHSPIKRSVSFNTDGIVSFFENHMIIYMLLLLIIAFVISYALNMMTTGPYTGIGKIVTSAIVVFGGLFIVEDNLSDVLFEGAILFFIAIILSIATASI
ncbi:MAG: restriction endonuclease [Methanosphaera sp.]|nr:restriction endonuclease [Methanosphaera sp.]